jgi:threonine efflux protein
MLLALTSIWLVHIAALLVPGANTLIVSHLAVSGHPKGAAYAAVGIAVGTALWACAAALGIKSIFEAFPTFRLTLQMTGGCYLLYIAYRLWKTGAQSAAVAEKLSLARAFRLGLLTNLSNPKAALFFGSIFSASLPVESSSSLFFSAVGLIVLNSLLWHLLLAYLFSRGRLQAAYEAKRKTVGRASSVVVGAFGLSLLTLTLREAKR